MLVNLEIKHDFHAPAGRPAAAAVAGGVGVVALRAVTLFFGRMTLDSLGEKTVAGRPARHVRRLIRRDLADLNAVHSGQFVSNFLYDATLMRDALTQGVAAIFLELVQLVVYLAYVLISDWQLGAAGADDRCRAWPGRWSGWAARCAAPPPAACRRPATCRWCCRKRWTGGASSRPMAWKSIASRGWMRG